MNRAVLTCLILCIGIGLGLLLATVYPNPERYEFIEWLDKPRAIRTFSLDAKTAEFNNGSLNGHWTIVLFGFLSCPDVCPTSLSQLAEISRILANKKLNMNVNFVFLSVDPARDSVAALSKYVGYFDSDILGVTGSTKQLASFAADLGIQFRIKQNNDDYSVSHSTTFSIIDPRGLFCGRFRHDFITSELTDNLYSKLSEH